MPQMKTRSWFLLWPFLFFLTRGCAPLPTCPDEVAAAFDIGSGSTKIQVAKRNSCDLTLTKTLMQTSKPVGYAQDLESRKAFSKEVIGRGEKAIQELMQKALEHRPQKVFGVATQAFRQASNGEAILRAWNKKYGWPFKLIDQEREAMLAYELVSLKLELSGDDSLMVWDIGGGSQQVVTRNEDGSLKIFKSNVAAVTFKNRVMKLLKKESQIKTPNPMSMTEVQKALKLARQMIRAELNSSFLNNIQRSQKVIGLGGVHGASIKSQLGLKAGSPVVLTALDQAISERVGFNDEQLGGDYASTELTNLILVKGLMLEYGLKSYTPLSASLTQSLLRQIP